MLVVAAHGSPLPCPQEACVVVTLSVAGARAGAGSGLGRSALLTQGLGVLRSLRPVVVSDALAMT